MDFERHEIVVRDGNGGKDRVRMLPAVVIAPLQAYLLQRRALFEDDKQKGKASVYMPDALERKHPNAVYFSVWQLFYRSA